MDKQQAKKKTSGDSWQDTWLELALAEVVQLQHNVVRW
jgi:hypothetical protein